MTKTAKKSDPKMDGALAALIRVSRAVGEDPLLVQGGGGNTSVKTADGRHMYIKASGTALKSMNAREGWRRMRIDAVLGTLEDPALARLDVDAREAEVVRRLQLGCEDDVAPEARPSVEAHLHALLDECVIHLHPVVVGSYVNAEKGEALIAGMFAGEEYPPLWVPYADPGFTLGRVMFKSVKEYETRHGRKPRIIFHEKHGLFVASPSPEAALQSVRDVVGRLSRNLRPLRSAKKTRASREAVTAAKLAVRKAVYDATRRYLPVAYFMTDAIDGFMARKDAGRLLAAGALSPDELVYANGQPLWLESREAGPIAARLEAQAAAGRKPPAAFLIKDTGLFVSADEATAPVVRDIVSASLFIRANAETLGGLRTLTRRQEDFINNWEAEAFRRRLAGARRDGELKNRIAVVTGGGSGLGRSIAVGLARAGAMTAVVDIDVPAAEATLDLIKKDLPGAPAMTIRCDVTDEKNVGRCFESLLERWGGLDILVNAAGVAPAYPLVELPVDQWRRALEINLTGYMLTAQAAARIMIKQAMGGSIVNISSKSGLEASKNNTPYNATKAGELHIARGWAMELGPYGIRVNSVAPGNVFEGSKIWNPEYIRTCAKKYGIKPSEVIPFYVNKTALKREIRGQDVADAVIFLCSEKARTITGQTLVPDSGQVMVR